MPDKGRRVASRQAQLGRRRRRQNRGPGGAPPVELAPEESNRRAFQPVATRVPEADGASPSAGPPASTRAVSVAAQSRSARTRTERPTAYNFVAPELRRILVLSGVLTAVLVVLAFFI